jgi:hypothetical protein
MRENALADRPQVEGGSPDPIGERRTIEMDPLALVDLRLAIERQVIGIFGDEHVGDHRLGWQAALDQPRRGLDNNILTGAAGVFGLPRDQNLDLGRHDVELLAHASPPRQQRQVLLSISTIVSMRGRWDGSAPRLARRLRAPSIRTAADFASVSTAVSASVCSTSSRASSS